MDNLLGHVETIGPHLFRKVKGVHYQRRRVYTPDRDFIDLDYLLHEEDSKQLVIICHGLEGSSNGPYVRGAAKYFFERGFNVLCPNYRSCSGEMNLLPRFYHSGATDDLDFIITKAKDIFSPLEIFMVGFSLGGNLITKYFGELGGRLDPLIIGAATFSVPLDLAGGSKLLNKRFNKIYEQNFLFTLKNKLWEKRKKGIISNEINFFKAMKSSNLWDFDERVTSPLHGFSGAKDYYKKNSGMYFIEGVQRPLLIVNAKNDPILAKKSFLRPGKVTNNIEFKSLEHGGHVGFSHFNLNNEFFSEKMAFDFYVSLI